MEVKLTHEKTPAKEPNHFERRRWDTDWKRNNKDHSNDHIDEFFFVYKLATSSIVNKPERKSTEDISNVRSGIH